MTILAAEVAPVSAGSAGLHYDRHLTVLCFLQQFSEPVSRVLPVDKLLGVGVPEAALDELIGKINS